MAPIHYKAKILPDGHLPVPEGLQARAGDEVEVTIHPSVPTDGEAAARQRAEYLLRKWAGIGRGSGSGVAERHDDILYGR